MITTIYEQARDVLERVVVLVAEGDLLSIAFALAVFWAVGAKALEHSETLRRVGFQCGLVAFMGFVVWSWATSVISTGPELANTALRAVIFGGLATALSWLVLAIGAFLTEQTLSVAAQILRSRDQ